jgi:hypothetical protein
MVELAEIRPLFQELRQHRDKVLAQLEKAGYPPLVARRRLDCAWAAVSNELRAEIERAEKDAPANQVRSIP